MSPFGTRGAAADLARALDGGAVSGTPDLALVAQLRAAGAALDAGIAPRPEFKDALRMRLMAVAAVQSAAPAAPAATAARAETAAPVRALQAAVSWRSRAGAVAAGAMASVVAVSGVAVAGSQSLPGDPFYGVKRTTEAFQLRTADGDVERGTRHLDFAATRLREVRGLALGRDAVDAGPQLGPAAMAGGITLRSAEQPLADGAALSAGVADRVRSTLAEMDSQTRKGTTLLTSAYRSSRTPEPLRALSRFTSRQTAGLEELLPALPPAAQPRARASLALLSDVGEQAEELLVIGTCGAGCDPSQAAPSVPGAPSTSTSISTSSGAPGSADCDCAAPAPAPQSSAVPPSGNRAPQTASPSPSPSASPSPSPRPSASPSPTPSPTPTSVVPVPVPVPVPTLPVPVPTLPAPLPSPTLTAPTSGEPVTSVLPGLHGSSSQQAPAEPVAPTLPQLTPVAPRP